MQKRDLWERLAPVVQGLALVSMIIVTSALLTINLVVSAIGLSTLPEDANGALVGIVNLLVLIASWPIWGLAAVCVLLVAAYLLQVIKLLSLIKRSQEIPEEVQSLNEKIIRIEEATKNRNVVIENRLKALDERVWTAITTLEETRHLADRARSIQDDLNRFLGENRHFPPNFSWRGIEQQARAAEPIIDEIVALIQPKLQGPWMKGNVLHTHSPMLQPDENNSADDIENYKRFLDKVYHFENVFYHFKAQRFTGLN